MESDNLGWRGFDMLIKVACVYWDLGKCIDIRLAYTANQLPSKKYNSNNIHPSMIADPINLLALQLSPNSQPYNTPFCFSFTFQSQIPLSFPLQWKIVFVGSAKDESYDQTLEEFSIDHIEPNKTMKFQVQCPAPDCTKIPRSQLLNLTAIIITVAYRNQQFLRIGYYVHVMIDKKISEEERKKMEAKELVQNLSRTVLVDKARITKFKIQWEGDQQKQKEKEKETEKENEKDEQFLGKVDKTDNSNSTFSASKNICSEKQVQIESIKKQFNANKKAKRIQKQTKKTVV